jgi:hypothetical protein
MRAMASMRAFQTPWYAGWQSAVSGPGGTATIEQLVKLALVDHTVKT